MNGKTAKLLKKLSDKSGLPYSKFKKYYKDLNSNQREQFKKEVKTALEET